MRYNLCWDAKHKKPRGGKANKMPLSHTNKATPALLKNATNKAGKAFGTSEKRQVGSKSPPISERKPSTIDTYSDGLSSIKDLVTSYMQCITQATL